MTRATTQSFLSRLVFSLLVLLVFDFGAAQVLKRMNRPDPVPVKDHEVSYGYTFRPNLDVVAAVWGHRTYRLKTNSLGFRDRQPRDVALRPSGRRIVFVGDSFTMGIGCDYEDTFVGIIDAELDQVEVLNAAVDGYSTMHYAAKIIDLIREQGVRCDELFVCIDLSDVAEDLARSTNVAPVTTTGQRVARRRDNDKTRSRIRIPHLPHTQTARQWLRANSVLVELAYRLKLRLAPNMPIDQRAVLWTSDDALYEEFGKAGIQLQQQYMAELAGVLDEHNIRLTIVVYPWIDQILRRDLESRQVEIWREWCAERGVRFINCFPAFVGRDEDPMTTVFECFIRGDNHFNEAGHRIMAECLLKEMKNSREKAQKAQKR